jgi:hypothetical protein
LERERRARRIGFGRRRVVSGTGFRGGTASGGGGSWSGHGAYGGTASGGGGSWNAHGVYGGAGYGGYHGAYYGGTAVATPAYAGYGAVAAGAAVGAAATSAAYAAASTNYYPAPYYRPHAW